MREKNIRLLYVVMEPDDILILDYRATVFFLNLL